MPKFYIDPGHGGTDSGAVGYGLMEKNLTLQITTRINEMLLNEYTDVSTRMSRTTDKTVSLKQRTDDANAWGADFLLSVHINAAGGTGYEDYIYPGSGATTARYQSIIHEEVMKQIDLADRGKKQANFHMLRESNMPALLTENGFIDNAADAAKLKQASYIERIARGHVNGLARAFNLQKKIQLTEGPYRLLTGTFGTPESQAGAAEKLRQATGWIVYAVEQNGLRLKTGTFRTREAAEKAQLEIINKFGWTVYVIE